MTEDAINKASSLRQNIIVSAKKITPYIFKEMAGIEVDFNEEMTRKVEYAVFKLRYRLAYAVTSLVPITGQVNGYVGLHLSNTLIFKATSTMVGYKIKEVNLDVKDAAGELCNCVAGNMKTDLDHNAIKINIGLPLVLCGTYVASSVKPPLMSSICVFTTPFGNGCVELAIDVPPLQ
jgi:CheY-specific phosphatase CheX